MGRRQLCIILLGFYWTAFGWLANAQQPHTAEPSATPTIRIATDLVTLEVSALDQAGNYVRDLRPEEFQVYESGRLKSLDFFTLNDRAALSRPLAVVFALDLSGSLKLEETNTLQNAARQFTSLLQGESVFAALGFNQSVKIYQGFTSEAQRLERAFARMNRFEGSTRLYDALDRAITMLSRRARLSRQGRPLRRVVVVITDGFDSASVIDRRELIRRASAADVTVYSVTLPSYMLSPTRSQERVLTPLDASRIVSATGGRDFSAAARDFTPIFKALAEEILASYALSYYPEKRDGQYRELRVTTTRAGVRLRVNRTGYTAPTSP